jgi:hypothetical protein
MTGGKVLFAREYPAERGDPAHGKFGIVTTNGVGVPVVGVTAFPARDDLVNYYWNNIFRKWGSVSAGSGVNVHWETNGFQFRCTIITNKEIYVVVQRFGPLRRP